MKANQPKRKLFNDAVDLLTGDAPDSGIQMLPVDQIKPFHEHSFKLYQGERLDDMVESIWENGILPRVIVRKLSHGYEMLAGHNRQNAARIAGLKEISVIVKENLTDGEAWVYVLETNVIQGSFSDLTITEGIAVLAARYDKVCSTKKREDIIEELHRLNDAGGHDVHQRAKSRELIGQEYGMTGRNMARYVCCNQLIPALKEMLDDGSLTLVSDVELSFLSEGEQELVGKVLEENGVRVKGNVAKKLKAAAGDIAVETVRSILALDKNVTEVRKKSFINVKVPADVYHRYFSEVDASEIQKILVEALGLYFKGRGEWVIYTRQELEVIDRSYFEVIIADEYDVTLMSRNTRHIWHLRNVELPDREVTVILHKHQVSDPYHAHGRSRTIKRAIRDIKKHDLFQMNGRKPVYKG